MRGPALSRTPFAALLCLVVATTAWAGDLRIVAPAAPGSSWDQLAQALKAALADERAVSKVEVVNVPGSGGTVGLAHFVADPSDDALLVTGLTMLDATFVHRSTVGLDQLTPIARLSAEYFALAVPAASPFRDLHELRAAAVADPGKVTWAGGPSAGIDHVAALLLARAIDSDSSRVVYVPFLTSAEAALAAAEGRVSAVFVSSGELAAEVKAGRIRLLGVASPSRIDTVDAPTFAESGITLDLANWRGVMARPGMPPDRRALLEGRVAGLAASAGWRELLQRKGWQNAYLPSEEFGRFLAAELERVKTALKEVGLIKR
ncbi:Bug family tripartite tricarboxylate transporter substrate binding protein [uncultured Enterovirga sp.]|uniref:Bug family tripartite tricarboxylate transporter substrate binding protein n=1 Tax=uncultured Enterovirga sp. TaxID=2026352 RepID=UPI0035CBEDD3